MGGLSRQAAAQDADNGAEASEAKPVAVVSLSGYKAVFEDIDYLGRSAGNDQLAASLEGALKLFTQQKGLAGLDKDRPWGAVVTARVTEDGETEFRGMAFVPVTDLKKLFSATAAFIGTPQDAGEGLYELEVQNIPIYVKEHNGWAFVSRIPDALADDLPDDPTVWLGDLTSKYDLAVQIHPQNVPEAFRQLGIEQMRMVVESGMKRNQQGADVEEFERQKAFVEQQMDQIESLVNDLERVTIGWSVEESARKGQLEIEVTAVEDSKMAEQFKTLEGQKTEFAGFLTDDAVAKFGTTGDVREEDAETVDKMLTAMQGAIEKRIDSSERLDAERKDVLKQVLTTVFEIERLATQSGRTDTAAAVYGEGPFTFISGRHVGDGAKAEELIKALLNKLENEPRVSNIQQGFAEHAGVTFHQFTVAITRGSGRSGAVDDSADEGDDTGTPARESDSDDADDDAAADDSETETPAPRSPAPRRRARATGASFRQVETAEADDSDDDSSDDESAPAGRSRPNRDAAPEAGTTRRARTAAPEARSTRESTRSAAAEDDSDDADDDDDDASDDRPARGAAGRGETGGAGPGRLADDRAKRREAAKALVDKFVGDELTVVIGVGEHDVYVAAGPEGFERLKTAIDASQGSDEADAKPLQAEVALTPILKAFAEADDDFIVSQFVSILEESEMDKIRLQAEGIDNGIRIRLEIEEGALAVIGQAAMFKLMVSGLGGF